LIDAASTQPVPQDPPLKDPKNFMLIGKPLKRFDTPNKTDGKVVYGIDAMLPGMKFATLAQCPVFGGKIGHVDDSAAKKIPGVRQIVVLDDLVAVVGDHMWAAKKGLDALVISWDEGTNAKINTRDIWDDLRAASKKDGVIAKTVRLRTVGNTSFSAWTMRRRHVKWYGASFPMWRRRMNGGCLRGLHGWVSHSLTRVLQRIPVKLTHSQHVESSCGILHEKVSE
jgi:CO/xanthine dehydrogenase Mo-binding subunit